MIFGANWEILSIIFFVILIIFLPIIMRIRIFSALQKTLLEMEEMVKDSKNLIINLSKETGDEKATMEQVDEFLDFFIIPPTDLDPNGIVQKFNQILELSESRFKKMVEIIAPKANKETKANIIMTLKVAIGLNSIYKMIRHNFELAKKTGNLQILLALQMNMPLIMRIFKAQYKGAKAFSKGLPVGDGAGPLTIAMLLKKEDKIESIDEMIYATREHENRKIVILRPEGPGARLGKVAKAVNTLIDKFKIQKIIMVDAAVKMEGEETGKVAEGVGIVIGGTGVEKWFIEDKILQQNIEIDSIVIKMSPEEAITQMDKKILEGCKIALKKIKANMKEDKNILIVGVGNSCGIPNILKDLSTIKLKEDDDEGE
ncbi:MAG TPA: DUF1512 family protein [Methanothermobacter sp.]|nr:DUF1512 family protein [Methanothermobacter sp.]HPQ05055.1 DUF1512 family protein [Methanothermobacter sp.]